MDDGRELDTGNMIILSLVIIIRSFPSFVVVVRSLGGLAVSMNEHHVPLIVRNSPHSLRAYLGTIL